MPAVLLQEVHRTRYRQLDGNWRSSGQVQDLEKLLILVAADVLETLDLPRHDGREARARWFPCRTPFVEAHRLPGVFPVERRRRHRAGRGADVAAKGEQSVEAG